MIKIPATGLTTAVLLSAAIPASAAGKGMRDDSTVVVVALVLAALCLIGYVLNIIRIFTGMGTARTAVIVVRVAGVFIPLIGIIAGFIANKPAED